MEATPGAGPGRRHPGGTIPGMPIDKISLTDKLATFTEQWAPKIIGRLNDYELKIVKVQGEFVWHQHDDTDEVFLVLGGELTIDLPDGAVVLGPLETVTVPRGVRHRPRAETETSMLLIEPADVVNTGEAGGEMTAVPESLL